MVIGMRGFSPIGWEVRRVFVWCWLQCCLVWEYVGWSRRSMIDYIVAPRLGKTAFDHIRFGVLLIAGWTKGGRSWAFWVTKRLSLVDNLRGYPYLFHVGCQVLLVDDSHKGGNRYSEIVYQALATNKGSQLMFIRGMGAGTYTMIFPPVNGRPCLVVSGAIKSDPWECSRTSISGKTPVSGWVGRGSWFAWVLGVSSSCNPTYNCTF